jgi:hypothetical protein
LYQYYHPDQLSTCYSTVYYRKNNYTLQNQESFNNKTVYTVRRIKVAGNDIEVKSDYVPTFLHKVDSFKAITGLRIVWLNEVSSIEEGQKLIAKLELSNPLSYSITGNNLFLNYTFFKSKADYKTSGNISRAENKLPPGYKKSFDISISPPSQPGKYKLIFSFDQPWLGPTFASPFYEVEVK